MWLNFKSFQQKTSPISRNNMCANNPAATSLYPAGDMEVVVSDSKIFPQVLFCHRVLNFIFIIICGGVFAVPTAFFYHDIMVFLPMVLIISGAVVSCGEIWSIWISAAVFAKGWRFQLGGGELFCSGSDIMICAGENYSYE